MTSGHETTLKAGNRPINRGLDILPLYQRFHGVDNITPNHRPGDLTPLQLAVKGKVFAEVEEYFAGSIIFLGRVNKFYRRSPDDTVQLLYTALLNREPDETGKGIYTDQIQNRRNLQEIIDEISGCQERRERQLRQMYEELLIREIDDEGMQFYLDQLLKNGCGVSDVAKSIKESNEYQQIPREKHANLRVGEYSPEEILKAAEEARFRSTIGPLYTPPNIIVHKVDQERDYALALVRLAEERASQNFTPLVVPEGFPRRELSLARSGASDDEVSFGSWAVIGNGFDQAANNPPRRGLFIDSEESLRILLERFRRNNDLLGEELYRSQINPNLIAGLHTAMNGRIITADEAEMVTNIVRNWVSGVTGTGINNVLRILDQVERLNRPMRMW